LLCSPLSIECVRRKDIISVTLSKKFFINFCLCPISSLSMILNIVNYVHGYNIKSKIIMYIFHHIVHIKIKLYVTHCNRNVPINFQLIVQRVSHNISKPRQQLSPDTLYVQKRSYVSDSATKQRHQFLFMLVNVDMLQYRRNMFRWVVLKRTSCLFPVTLMTAQSEFHLSVRKIMRFSVRICCLSRIRSEDSRIRCASFCPAVYFSR
jgi:hypothetical protein